MMVFSATTMITCTQLSGHIVKPKTASTHINEWVREWKKRAAIIQTEFDMTNSSM
jgi:hypothetical protein